ncbi:tyrosine-type recombinase/integrase [Deinococcus koreensis]|uniref:Site-specific integrase n=1 Tax=Deinococcus koreensis TaxID=2054903 RepID=A0A2K3V1T7_9DEIO|nr:tyrosine-type recombinase/integrase [Deinococcus koreensis]PNY82741.1 hypothetical protein CVO96_16515 [Deinococcus koreensis]
MAIELPPFPDGQRHRIQKTFKTRADAVEYTRTVDYAGAARQPQRAASMTVAQVLGSWAELQRGGSYSTRLNRSWLIEILTLYIGHIPVTGLTTRDIEVMMATMLTDGRAQSTVAKALRHLRVVLRKAVTHGYITRNPAEDVRPPTVSTRLPDEVWTFDELQQLLTAAKLSRIYPMVLLALNTGARIGELLGARMSDYSATSGLLEIRGTAKREGGRGRGKTAAADRDLMLPPLLQDVLEAHLLEVARRRARAGSGWNQKRAVDPEVVRRQRKAARRAAARPLTASWIPPRPQDVPAYDALFPTSTGTPWSAGNVRKCWRAVLSAAGLEHRRFHSTRGTFITHALELANFSLADIQAAVGHTSPAMTLRYAQRRAGRQPQLIAAVSNLQGLYHRASGAHIAPDGSTQGLADARQDSDQHSTPADAH